jgi:hypothetical protein
MLNKSNQPTQFGHFSCLVPPISNEVSDSQKDLYDVTDSSWDFLRFQSRVFRFYSTDGTSRYYMSSQIFSHFIALVLMHFLFWLVMFVAQISTTFSTPVPRMCVLYHNFIAYFLFKSRRISLISSD